MALSYKEVAEILKIIDASECEEVILELEGIKLTVRRGAASAGHTPSTQAPAPTIAVPAPAAEHQAGEAVKPELLAVETGDITLRAPMVGTFYRAPSPDKPPFVEEASRVSPGDPICLIEVMKLYTTIEATHAGTIRKIAVNDGELVEFDQPLFVIEPA